jgi:hypothetical protein
VTKTYEKASRALERSSYTSSSCPWWFYPRNSHEVAMRLQNTFKATSGFHELRLSDQAAAQWLYEHDRFTFSSYPEFLDDSKYCDWWGSGWYKGGPRSNLVKQYVDRAVSWLFTDMPRLEVRANGAHFELQNAIEDRSLALDQTVDSDRSRLRMMEVGRDGLLTGWGAVRPVQAEDSIHYLRVQPHECWWDPADAEKGDPWAICIAERRDRWELCSWYESQEYKALGLLKRDRDAKMGTLEKLRPTPGDWLYGNKAFQTPYQWQLEQGGSQVYSDQVLVLHAWRRSTTSVPERADGRYVMIACGPSLSEPLLLMDAPYLWTRLPVCWWAPYPAPSGGLCGTGIAHQLRGHQRASDHSDAVQQEHLDELGWKKVAVDPATMGAAEDDVLTDMAARKIAIIRVPGLQIPQIFEPPALHEGHLRYSDLVRSRAAVDSGLPATIASGTSNRGAGASGVAMIEESDRATDAVSGLYHQWQFMRIQVAERTMELIEDCLKQNRDFRATFRDEDGSWRAESWGKLHRFKEAYAITLETAGALGRTRYGRIMRALDLASKGMLDPALARQMVENSPDVRAALRLQSAPRLLVFRKLRELISPDGDHAWGATVHKDMDLSLADQMAWFMLNKADEERADFETIERLRTFRATVRGLLDEEAEANAPAPAPTDPGGVAPSADAAMPALGLAPGA